MFMKIIKLIPYESNDRPPEVALPYLTNESSPFFFFNISTFRDFLLSALILGFCVLRKNKMMLIGGGKEEEGSYEIQSEISERHVRRRC